MSSMNDLDGNRSTRVAMVRKAPSGAVGLMSALASECQVGQGAGPERAFEDR